MNLTDKLSQLSTEGKKTGPIDYDIVVEASQSSGIHRSSQRILTISFGLEPEKTLMTDEGLIFRTGSSAKFTFPETLSAQFNQDYGHLLESFSAEFKRHREIYIEYPPEGVQILLKEVVQKYRDALLSAAQNTVDQAPVAELSKLENR